LEQLLYDFRSKARPAIGNRDLNGFLVAQCRRHNEFTAPALTHCLECIAHQIDEDLLDLHPICEHR